MFSRLPQCVLETLKQLLHILQTIPMCSGDDEAVVMYSPDDPGVSAWKDTGDSVHAEVFTCSCIYVFSRLSQCLRVLVFMYSPDYPSVYVCWCLCILQTIPVFMCAGVYVFSRLSLCQRMEGDSVHVEVFMYMFACVHGSLVV